MDLSSHRTSSPLEAGSLLGTVHWMNLLNRPLYACLSSVYAFVRKENQTMRVTMWENVLSELLLNCSLNLCWIVDLCRPWSPRLFVSDASPTYGYGLCMACVPPSSLREAASAAGKLAAHFTLQGNRPDGKLSARPGVEYRLPLRRRDFKVVVNKRAARTAHSGEMEMQGAVIMIRRVVRDKRLHGHRHFFLMDAIAPLLALQKGRSSAPTLRHGARRFAAYTLAGHIRCHFGYVPSEWNVADLPSRQKVVRRRCNKTRAPPKLLRSLERRIRDVNAWNTMQRGGRSRSCLSVASAASTSSW